MCVWRSGRMRSERGGESWRRMRREEEEGEEEGEEKVYSKLTQ